MPVHDLAFTALLVTWTQKKSGLGRIESHAGDGSDRRVVMVKKDFFLFFVDYHKVNDVSQLDTYLISHAVEELLDQLRAACFFYYVGIDKGQVQVVR